MMFAGTYRSEFYRAVRNLLHDEVAHPGTVELARRWDELCSREHEYRQVSEAEVPLRKLLGGLQSATAFP
jgi:hypothetical protein